MRQSGGTKTDRVYVGAVSSITGSPESSSDCGDQQKKEFFGWIGCTPKLFRTEDAVSQASPISKAMPQSQVGLPNSLRVAVFCIALREAVIWTSMWSARLTKNSWVFGAVKSPLT